MPLRRNYGVAFVKSAPHKKNTGCMPIKIEEASTDVLEYWHRNIQKPFINNDFNRADRGWNWPRIDRNFGAIGWALHQEPRCYMVVKEMPAGLLPLALVFQAEKYPALQDNFKESCFLWFMAAAPEAFLLKHLPVSEVPSLGKIIVDIGVTTSYNNSNDGIIGLHSSPYGGARLRNFYANKCSLANLPSNTIISLARHNDGNYFYATESIALTYSKSNDSLR